MKNAVLLALMPVLLSPIFASAEVQTPNTPFPVSATGYDNPVGIDGLKQVATSDARQMCFPLQSVRVSVWQTTFLHYGAYWAVEAEFVCQ
jgi:hypothetical protein